MSASTAVITDLTTMANATGNSNSQALATAAAGPIQDIKGQCSIALRKAQELKQLLTELDTVIHSGDTTIQTPLTAVLAVLV